MHENGEKLLQKDQSGVGEASVYVTEAAKRILARAEQGEVQL